MSPISSPADRNFRPIAVEFLTLRGLNRRQAEVLGWMVDLIDRIGEGDISGN